MKQRWRNYLFYLSVILFIGGFIYILIETIKAKNTGFETKTLWDWMELLIIPVVLAGGAILLNRSERALERKIAEDRAKLEQNLATDRQQEAALQTYFDRMSELLLKEKLRTTKKAEVRDVARTRTLSIMRVMDTKRNNLILQFLYEAKLITDAKSIFKNVKMQYMYLQSIRFGGAYLVGADLTGADLTGADLRVANLAHANLARANLTGADLMGADLQGANLEHANLTEANLPSANLTGTFLVVANLADANLALADLTDAKLMGANLTDANLTEANLASAFLPRANFTGADLTDAILAGADLAGANLQGAKNISEEQLASVQFLKGATMPDGTTHE